MAACDRLCGCHTVALSGHSWLQGPRGRVHKEVPVLHRRRWALLPLPGDGGHGLLCHAAGEEAAWMNSDPDDPRAGQHTQLPQAQSPLTVAGQATPQTRAPRLVSRHQAGTEHGVGKRRQGGACRLGAPRGGSSSSALKGPPGFSSLSGNLIWTL